MSRRSLFLFAVLSLGVLSGLIACSAQTESEKPFSHLGIAVKVSSLGAGIEAATPLTRRSNLRAGFNIFSYDRGFHKDGISYDGKLRFRSVEAHYDWFPWAGSFHVSPGALVYNGNQIAASASVPGTQTFTLDGTDYRSDPADPVNGTGKVDFVKAAPMFTVGWGNLLPRNQRRFSVPVELGVIYTGSPRTLLNLGGSACDPTGLNCASANSYPGFQANVQAERDKLNRDMSAFRFYPVLSVGFGFNF
ncbi:MAG TPA: hypothetical protein VFL34_02165 [Candidatus Sulfotelmatobacter sp.]|nr:hypothetical protein [Candidatus Sulfotelmatobacter sp.]